MGADMGEMIPELVAVRMAVTEPDPAAVRYTAAGSVYLSPTLMFSAQPFEAWEGIQDLHFQSIGRTGSGFGGLSEAEAFGAYSTSVAGVLGQLAVTDATAGNRLLGGLNDYLDFTGRMDGLEGPFLSAYSSAAQLGETHETHRAGQLWGSIPQPQGFGGHAQRTTIFDAGNGQLKMPNGSEFQSAFGAGQSIGQGMHELHQGGGSHPTGGNDSSAAGTVYRVSIAVFAGQSFGAAAGAELGALIGVSLGPIGGIVGGIVGGIIAFFAGGSSSPPTGSAGEHHPAAKGEHVVVHNSPVVHPNGHDYQYNKGSGKIEERPGTAGSHGSSPHPPPGHRETIHPSPHKCFRDDDGTLDDEFSLPFWGSGAAVAPSVIPEGAGVEGLISYLGDGALAFEALPALDASGAIEAAGLLATVLSPDSLGPVDPGGIDPGGIDPGTRLTRVPDVLVPGGQLVAMVDPDQFLRERMRAILLTRLRAANVPAGTPLYEATEILRRREGS
jgi:hypothetical protein